MINQRKKRRRKKKERKRDRTRKRQRERKKKKKRRKASLSDCRSNRIENQQYERKYRQTERITDTQKRSLIM